MPGETFDTEKYMHMMWQEHGIVTAGGSGTVQDRGYAGSRVGLRGFL